MSRGPFVSPDIIASVQRLLSPGRPHRNRARRPAPGEANLSPMLPIFRAAEKRLDAKEQHGEVRILAKDGKVVDEHRH